MKSEERHELQTNELDKLMKRATPFFEQYGSKILLGLCAAVLVLSVGVYMVRSSTAGKSAGWTDLYSARSPEDFANVADDYEGTDVGAWARLQESESYLRSGVRLAFTDRAAGNSDLNQAKEGFQKLLSDSSVPPVVRERALFGMARSLESTSGSDTAKAVAAYEKFASEFPDSLYAPSAKKRKDVLETGGAKEFYAWFQEQTPEPSDRGGPMDGFPGGQFPFGNGSSTDLPITLPPIPEGLKLPEEPESEISFPAPDAVEKEGNGSAPPPPKPESADSEKDDKKPAEEKKAIGDDS